MSDGAATSPIGLSRRAPRRGLGLLRSAALYLAGGLALSVVVAWALALTVEVPGEVYGPNKRPARSTRVYVNPPGHAALKLTIEPSPPPPAPGVPVQLDRPSVLVVRWGNLGSAFYQINTSIGSLPTPPTPSPLDETVPWYLGAGGARDAIIPWLTGAEPWPGRDVYRFVGARGWPMLCAWCEYKSTNLPWVNKPVGGLEVPWPTVSAGWYLPPPPVTALPMQPVWVGLGVNTVFWGAALWLALRGVGRLRAARRFARGLCGQCGYDRRGLSAGVACPECGSTARGRAAVDSPGPTAIG